MMRLLGLKRLWALIAVAHMVACAGGGDASTSPSPDGSRGVTQGGPQDIARFREIVEEGNVPSPETLDPVGFFAEHKIDLPEADCGRDVCLHPMLAVAPRFDGSNWTMGFVAMNSPVDPATLERPALHLVLAVERTARTQAQWRAVENGLRALVGRMREGDRISLVTFDERADIVLEGAPAQRSVLEDALYELRDEARGTAAALYDGLATAGRTAQGLESFDGRSRMLLLTSGHADVGITDPERVRALASGYAREGIALNVIGFSERYQRRLPERLGELGIGTYSRAEDPTDLENILRSEGATTMYPLATDFELHVDAAPGYRVGRIYGARRARADLHHAELSSPALFLGHRTSADDVSGGRRGGGGGLFVELIAEEGAASRGAGQPAFTMSATWTSSDGEPMEVSQTVVNKLAPGQNPDEMWPEFSHPEHGKPFMMLNMYLTLRSATRFQQAGDCPRAQGVIDMVAPTVEMWQSRYDDPDIWADFDLMMALRDNIAASCTAREPVEPRGFSGGCMAL